jgi:hypothetical protein
METREKRMWGMIALVVVLMGVFGLSFLILHNREIRKIQKTQTDWQKQAEMATVKKGEGVEHALIRQIAANPENFGFVGNKEDAKAVKKWAGKKAHQIAIKAGYVDMKTGREIRVKLADKIAYVLVKDKDGDSAVYEFEKGDDGKFKNIPIQINKLSPDYVSAKFLGDSPDEVQGYEYVFQP